MRFLRRFLWRLLGIDYHHILRSIDFVFLKEDKFTVKEEGTYENGAKVWRWSDAPLRIGKYCSIANNVNFIVDDANHQISQITSFPLFDNLFSGDELVMGKTKKEFLSDNRKKAGIMVGNDVWIGMGATILPGVKIGNGVTIAAGSVVTNDVASYCIVGGVPAKVIADKCSQSDKEAMESIGWWNWERDVIKGRIADFIGLSINDFINKYAIIIENDLD